MPLASALQTWQLTVNMGVRRGGQNGHLPPMEIGTKNQKFLVNLKSVA